MLYIIETLGDINLLSDERISIVAHLSALEVGDRLSLGAQRLLHVVGVDYFENEGERIGVAYLDLSPDRDRSTWFLVEECAYRPCHSLTAYLADGELIQWKHSMRDTEPEVGFLLNQYNVADRTVTPKPWGVASYRKFMPVTELEHPCHRHVYLAECVYTPESIPEPALELAVA